MGTGFKDSGIALRRYQRIIRPSCNMALAVAALLPVELIIQII